MKLVSASVMFLTLIISSYASAITEIPRRDVAEKMGLQSMGVISLTVDVSTQDQAVEAIAKKAEKEGADYYRVIGARDYDTSPYWRVSAEIYRAGGTDTAPAKK
ncbi:hypothetical protein SOASR030_12160 [Leminorella grimontii]|uniref:YdgH/BhsA/McbA-like domain-containing protein n=1 Tax=Leminorella grimontii TaxID=82981 RepID=A0AAV5N0E3_9GAMM|nr:DUF1471 domain-containing protein [Leminorella grimontii]KFC97535.1 hypothetical protein GLGR_0470 [Leminorella grimontii ATCC 33999 = DSM 5078]GKX55104.1 hypothetical protein SOASR030_12160 [Leminorella grimontii]GKX58528.1 hypothetical protein SOASR031_08430 [Leminorella grimontii]VFS56908.1 putative biofilm stress and motility protein A [Leminorella grimontii]